MMVSLYQFLKQNAMQRFVNTRQNTSTMIRILLSASQDEIWLPEDLEAGSGSESDESDESDGLDGLDVCVDIGG